MTKFELQRIRNDYRESLERSISDLGSLERGYSRFLSLNATLGPMVKRLSIEEIIEGGVQWRADIQSKKQIIIVISEILGALPGLELEEFENIESEVVYNER